MDSIGRRRYLLAGGALGMSALAGCLGNGDDGDDEADTTDTNGDVANGDDADGAGADDTATGDDTGGNGDDDTNENGTDDTGDDEPSTDELSATLETTEGDIELVLYPEKVPETVDNFVGLATGDREWEDPESGETRDDPLYDDVLFHRVIDGFMIQTGDPLGNGTGGPGYTFDDEFHPDLRHDSAGILSMANRGPNTNGSQFFITLAAQPHLDDQHAVFGEVVEGMDVVEAIGAAETDGNDRPLEDILLSRVVVHD